MEPRLDSTAMGKILAVAFAVGLDVFAISVGIGLTQRAFYVRRRVGLAFAGSEIAMLLIGYALGAGAGRLLGSLAAYLGSAMLALIGLMMVLESRRDSAESKLDATSGLGLLVASISISLDSLGVGIALPNVSIPLLPLLITVSISTILFTLIGLAFGARLGERYGHYAKRAAGIMLIALAALFFIEQAL